METELTIKLNPVSIHVLLTILEHQFNCANRDPTNAIALYEDISEQVGEIVKVDRGTIPYFRNIEETDKAKQKVEEKKSSWRKFLDSF